MSNINKIIKEGIENLLETKGFEDMEVAFGVKYKNDNLSDAEKNQFGPMGQLKTNKGGSFTNPKVPGTKMVDKANAEGGREAQSYYKEVAKKVKDYQIPNDEEKYESPKIPTNTSDDETKNERLETSGYDIGVSGMEVVMDKAATEGGSEAEKKKYKERMDKLQGDKYVYDYMKKSARATNDLKYTKDARNTRPAKAQKSRQPEQPELKNEGVDYKDIDTKNIFKANGKLVSEEQVIKLTEKIPSRVKIDETVFAITDGENTYKLIWEGDSKTGEAIITNFKNTQQVNEDIQKMKYLWGFKATDSVSTKKNVTENTDESFKKIFNIVKKKRINENTEELNEGLKDWLVGGLITLTAIGGIGKVYKMNQQQEEDKKSQQEYYNNVLSKGLDKMSEDDLENLGIKINSKTKALSLRDDKTPEELHKIFKTYADNYIKTNPQEFAIGLDGSIYKIK